MCILHKGNNCTQRGLLNLDGQANYAALFFLPITFSAVTKLHTKIWTFPQGAGFIYSNLCTPSQGKTGGCRLASCAPVSLRRHAWGVSVSSALSLQACSPASHNTSPCPAAEVAAREVTTGCQLTRAPHCAVLPAAGSFSIAHFSWLSCWLPHLHSRAGWTALTRQAAEPPLAVPTRCPQCPLCPPALLHCKSPPHTSAGYSCQSSTERNLFQTLCLQQGANALSATYPKEGAWLRPSIFPGDPVPPVVLLQHIFLHPEPCLLVKFLIFLQMVFGHQ